MAQKNATPSREQQEILRRNYLDPLHWTIVRDLRYSMIIRNRQSGETRVVCK